MDNIGKIAQFFPEEDWVTADGFDDAIIGVHENKIVYSISKCIEILKEDMTEEEAVEFFEFNVSGSYIGEQTPIFIEDNMF